MHLADLNAEAAEAVARQVRQADGSAEAHAVDVCDADGRVDILHNNDDAEMLRTGFSDHEWSSSCKANTNRVIVYPC